MTTQRDEEKLREVADHHAADNPALAAQLCADADYLAQLRKAPTNINGHGEAEDVLRTGCRPAWAAPCLSVDQPPWSPAGI
jgi:hypothetical protein